MALVTAYDELKVRIERGDGGSHRVLVTSEVGEASGEFVLPFGELEVENFVLRVSRPRGVRRIEASAMGDAKRFGGQLFDALFRDRVRDIYREALASARPDGRGVRITLCLSGVPELMDVPWEYLYDEPDFLSVSAFTPVVRYLDLPRAHRPLRVEPPLRILAMVASPSDYERLDTDRERANLEGALDALVQRGAVQIDWLERPTLSSLLRALQTDTYHVLHFVGHGSYDERAEQGLLLFEDENGWGRPVTGDKLGVVLHDFTSLRLVVLNACEGARTSSADPASGVAASLVRREIPAVIAMQFEITDLAAVVFAQGFYHALASGSPVDASLALARLAIFAERSDDIEWGTPVLFMRVPDGRIFDLPDSAGPVISPPAQPAESGRLRALGKVADGAEAQPPPTEQPSPAEQPPPAEQPLVRRRPPVRQPPSAAQAVPAPSGPQAVGVERAGDRDTGRRGGGRGDAGARGGARRDGSRRRRIAAGGGLVALVALIAVLIIALGSGGGGHTAPLALVDRWINAYNHGDDYQAASLWSPATGTPATARPGYPADAPTRTLLGVNDVIAFFHNGCERQVLSRSASGDVVRVVYQAYGHRLGRERCTASQEKWQDEFTVISGHIIAYRSTRIG